MSPSMLYCVKVHHRGIFMSKRVISIAKTKGIGSVWEQPLRVAAYCRVSTDSEEQRRSLQNQIEFYSNYIRRQTNWTLVNVYSDTTSGIRTKKRYGYQQLLKDCRKGKIDLIIVKSLSRFGRDTKETIEQIRRLKRMNIGVYVETGGFNTLETNDSLIGMRLLLRPKANPLVKIPNSGFVNA